MPQRPGALLLAAAVMAASVGGCATGLTSGQIADLTRSVEWAATMPPGVLQARADTGDAQAQYAWSLVLGHGLQGVPADLTLAALYRSRAMGQRGYTPVTQYTAAFEGQPSRVNIINVPRYDLTPMQAAVIDACADSLTQEPAWPETPCGDLARHRRLAQVWSAARLR